MPSTANKKRAPSTLRSTADTSSAKSSLALGLSAAMLMPLSALAQSSAPAAAPAAASAPVTSGATATATELPAVKVQSTAIDPNPNAETGVPYKARTSGDVRHTRPLAETPKTITVITKTAMDESGYTDLKQVLGAQPGITLGTGETGNAFGDRYIIRGQEARSDVFVDGLRDPGMTTRETFATEQLELSKGPSSSFAGRGTAGGAINAITKQATLDYDFARLSLGLGTDRHVRATVDGNKAFSDTFALRVNALYGTEDVPGRDPASRDRKGLALSGLWEVNPGLSVVVDYYGLRADDKPDLGGYLLPATGSGYRQHARNVPVYVQDGDFLRSDVDTLTARVNYQVQPNIKLINLTRYGQSDNRYLVSGAMATTGYLPGGGTYSTAHINQSKDGWQEVEYFANQTNLRIDSNLFGKKNELIFGLELTDHQVLNGRYTFANSGAFNCRTGSAGAVNNAFCITTPTGAITPGLNSMMGRNITGSYWDIDWRVKSLGLSVMDTVDLTDKWTVFGGLRADHFDLSLKQGNATGPTAAYKASGLFYSGHLGATYKINEQGVVYASYASASDVNGGESDVTSSAYGGPVIYNGSISGADPEFSQNYEIGTKWNVLDDRLLLTAALFQTDKSDVTEGTAGYTNTGSFNSGANRVRGVEFGATGYLTDKLSGQIGVTFMKSEVTKSFVADNEGLRLSNFANRSASVQLKYEFTDAFALGGAWHYVDDRFAGCP